jgi:transposase-like protein
LQIQQKGASALELSTDLGCQYRTAFVLAHKVREALFMNQDTSLLKGEIHIDGAYMHHSLRPKNKKEDRIDRRLAKNQPKDKCCVLVMRQGTEKTRTFVIKREEGQTILNLVKKHVDSSSVIHADEHKSYDILNGKFDIKRVNHSKEYRSNEGVTNNYAESFFSRLRRMQIGQHHKITNKYLSQYSNELAYREDTRRMSNGDIVYDIIRKCLGTGVSSRWVNHCRRYLS